MTTDDPLTRAPRFAVAAKVAGCLLVVATGLTLLRSLGLQFHIEPTADTLLETAWPGLPLGLVAIVTRRRTLAVVAALAGVAVLTFGGAQAHRDLHPEAGERRVAVAFRPPPGAVRETQDQHPWQGYQRPTLTIAWRVPASTEAAVCADARRRMAQWSTDAASTSPELQRGCTIVGRRDGHDGFVVAHAADDDPTAIEVVLSVTRRA